MLYYKMINRKKNLLEEIQNLENALALIQMENLAVPKMENILFINIY